MRIYIVSLLSLFILYSCGPDNGNGKEAKGGRMYGGTLKLSETEKFQSIYPYSVTDVISSNICYQIYEGLLKFNPRNPSEVLPCLAAEYKVNAEGTVYTFKLKSGVFFHDDPCFPDGKGREVTAEDVAREFVALALATKTTAAIVTVDGGNIEASLR